MLDTTSLDNFLKDMSNAGPKIIKTIEDELEDQAIIIQDEAKANAPVKTGALRDSISVDMKGLSALITATVPYADEVHARDPFMMEAANDKESTVMSNIEESYYNAVEKAAEEA